MKNAVPFLCLALIFGGSVATRAQDAAADATTTATNTQTTATTDETAPKSVKDRLDDLQSQIDVIKDSMNEPEGSIQTTVNDVKGLKKVKVSGYIQVRYDNDQSSDNGKNNKNTFDVRRARIKVAGSPTDNTTAVIQLDASGGTTVSVKDANIAYTFGNGDIYKNYSVTFGQMLWPFGYQLVQSSSVRETPEPAIVVQKLFPGDYDRGVKLSSPLDNRIFWEVGLYNGVGIGKTKDAVGNTIVNDNNNYKDIVGRVRFHANDALDFGTSVYKGKSVTAFDSNGNATEQQDKNRFGIDAQYYFHDTTLKAEYISGEDKGVTEWGYYAQIAHNFTKKDTGVVMYDVYQDHAASVQAPTGTGKTNALNIGWIHALDTATRLKLFYTFNNEENKSVDNNLLRVELITLF